MSERNEDKRGINPISWLSGAFRSLMSGGQGAKSANRMNAQKGNKKFWKRSRNKLPGKVTQVRGAQFRPLNGHQEDGKPKERRPEAVPYSLRTAADTSSLVEGKEPTDGPKAPVPSSPSPAMSPSGRKASRLQRFRQMLVDTDLEALRKLAWSGVSVAVRAPVWQLLLGYLPVNPERRAPMLARRRAEYRGYVKHHYEVEAHSRTENEQAILRQIKVDVPRTCPDLKMIQHPKLQGILERILYVWALRHPASGYVQGINDIATPFLLVFLAHESGHAQHCKDDLSLASVEMPAKTLDALPEDMLSRVEADAFWCLSKLVDGIQDNYTFAQPGIQRMVFRLTELISRIDHDLYKHIVSQEVQFMQFAFRWFNCLLMRELSLPLIVRVWDTYLANPQGDGFKTFHLYVCAAFLVHWTKELRRMDFQELVVFLQRLPCQHWGENEVSTLLAQAFVYKSLFEDAPRHLQ